MELVTSESSLASEGKTVLKGNCGEWITPVKDALDALYGRWKIPIIVAVSFGPKRFRQITAEVGGITDKSLSKELKELEINKLISRKVIDSFPPRVEYTLTEHGHSLKDLMIELRAWGRLHRLEMFGQK